MSTVALTENSTGAKWNDTTALVASWGGAEQQTRVFAALRTCLADDTLPELPAEVRLSLPGCTRAPGFVTYKREN